MPVALAMMGLVTAIIGTNWSGGVQAGISVSTLLSGRCENSRSTFRL